MVLQAIFEVTGQLGQYGAQIKVFLVELKLYFLFKNDNQKYLLSSSLTSK